MSNYIYLVTLTQICCKKGENEYYPSVHYALDNMSNYICVILFD